MIARFRAPIAASALAVGCGAGLGPDSIEPPVTAPVAPVLNQHGEASSAAEPDAEIASMLGSVDARRIHADVRSLAGFGTRHSLSDPQDERRGVGASARWLRARFAEIAASSSDRLQVELQDFVAPQGPRIPKPWPMQNVVAVLPGRDPKRALVVSGHYDSRASDVMNATIDAPGANDDASGVAVVLEACRSMAAHRFEATIVFAAVTGEEQGLFGAHALVQDLEKKNISVEAMLTNDIVGASRAASGRADKQRVRVFSAGLPHEPTARERWLAVGGEADGPSRQLARAVDEATESYVGGFEAMLVHRFDRYLRGGDHRPFHEAGVPAARLTEVEENFNRQHQDVRTEAGVAYGDLPDHVDPSYMANVARVNIATLASLGRAPARPRAVRLDVRGLDQDTTLLFVPDPDAAVRYEVLARPSAASEWTEALPIDRSGSARIPRSKDHWTFALRAIGPRGHRSLAVFPLPLKTGDPWPPP